MTYAFETPALLGSVSRQARRLAPVASVFVIALAAWLAWRALRNLRPALVLEALATTPPSAVAAALALAAVSYACLATEEWHEFWLLTGRRLPVARTAWTSFRSNALSGVMGFGAASGAAVRMRLYRWSGLKAPKIASVSLLSTFATYIGGIVTMGLAVFVDPLPLAAAFDAPLSLVSATAVLLTTPAALWFVAFKPRTRKARLRRPGTRHRAIALAAGIGDWASSGAALFVLTGQDAASLPAFLAIFCLGSLAGGVAGIPAGLGVLEATLLSLHARALMHETAAALILYRAVYYLAPLAVVAAHAAMRGFIERAAARTRPAVGLDAHQ